MTVLTWVSLSLSPSLLHLPVICLFMHVCWCTKSLWLISHAIAVLLWFSLNVECRPYILEKRNLTQWHGLYFNVMYITTGRHVMRWRLCPFFSRQFLHIQCSIYRLAQRIPSFSIVLNIPSFILPISLPKLLKRALSGIINEINK